MNIFEIAACAGKHLTGIVYIILLLHTLCPLQIQFLSRFQTTWFVDSKHTQDIYYLLYLLIIEKLHFFKNNSGLILMATACP